VSLPPQPTEATPAGWDADVIVVGAGLAGLVTARTLVAAGCSVIVLEARDRVGGRIRNVEVDGTVLEAGAQWIGPTQDRVAALAADLGVSTFAVYDRGAPLLELAGVRRRMHGVVPPVRPAAAIDLLRAMRRLVRIARPVPVGRPWEAPDAGALDAVTFGHWIATHVRTPEARSIITAGCRLVFADEPERISLLHVAHHVRFAGGVRRLVAGTGGAHERRFVGGSGQLPLRLAHQLGDRIRLDQPVRHITRSADRVAVRTHDLDLVARHAVVTVPPPLAAAIDHRPPLPVARQTFEREVTMGRVIKIQATYEDPFWRRYGLSGQLLGDDGPVGAMFDNSPPDGRPGVLLGFVTGRAAARLAARAPASRRNVVLDHLGRAFGPRARTPRSYVEHDWQRESWSRGGYFGRVPPGVWTRTADAVRQPVGRVHWAGTETAERWFGYMDGAVESGLRAAAEILRAERVPTPGRDIDLRERRPAPNIVIDQDDPSDVRP
jgi:monoamine oxidase